MISEDIRTATEQQIAHIEAVLEAHMNGLRADCCNREDYQIVRHKSNPGRVQIRWKGEVISGHRIIFTHGKRVR